MEVWKDIKGYDGLYKVSNLGRIYSYPRNGTKGGYSCGNKVGDGYLCFQLYKNDVRTPKLIHILVYEAFVGEIPKDCVVHHKNHNKLDNRLENLELMLESEHQKMHYEENRQTLLGKTSTPVIQYTLDGEFVAEYKSIGEAERQTKISGGSICKCCNNKPHHKTAGGYIWKFKDAA